MTLCERWCREADRKWANKQATGFPGPHGRQRQRAYHDALRDIATPAMGRHRLSEFRIPLITGEPPGSVTASACLPSLPRIARPPRRQATAVPDHRFD